MTTVSDEDLGLSPLARGTRRDYSKEDAGDRFIPAGAGNTFKYVYLLIAISGLSPLARGTPALFAALSLVARFIPAGAGNTVDGEFFIAGAPVYPRWRGEHSAYFRRKPYEYGLSPLARGTPRQKVNAAKNERFIPAGAGNTRRWHRQTPVLSVYPRWRGEHTLLTV